jgi:glycosyltransferase involved in cell wall biosynthesis
MPFFRKCYLRATELLISAFSTVGLACSVPAAADLFGAGWQKQSKNKVLHCGIDLNDFAGKVNKGDILREFNIPTHAKIVGHVGRFVPVKNHDFILEIARDLIQVDPSVYFLLLGGGNLRKRIQEKIEMLGINSNIVLAGVRSDVPKLLSNIMDVFVLPSFYEGLGLSFVEAQTAGLPCVVSDTIPLEADIIPDLVTRLSLTTPASLWANKIRELLNKERLVDRESSLRKVKGSSFNIDYSVRSLEEIYSGNPGSPSCG